MTLRTMVATVVCLLSSLATAQSSPPTAQVPLAPKAITPFVQPLPVLDTAWSRAQWPDTATQKYPRIPVVFGNAKPDASTGGLVPSADGLDVTTCEFQTQMLPPGTVLNAGASGLTWNWGYVVGKTCPDPTTPRDTYLGPVIVNVRSTATNGFGATEMRFVNGLSDTKKTNVLFWARSTDQTLHWADPLHDEGNMCAHMGSPGMFPMDMTGMGGADCRANYAGPIPAVPHLHGGEVPPQLDGGPDAWVTSDGLRRGHGFYTKGVVGEVAFLPALPNAGYPAGAIVFNKCSDQPCASSVSTELGGWVQVTPDGKSWSAYTDKTITYTYPNRQEAAPIWFHDHTLGATRLNVYAGIAGGYYIVEPGNPKTFDPGNPSAGGVPGVDRVVPIILQDREFDTDGQLFFQAGSAGGILWALNPDHPYWSPEFIGDTIVVNGKAWPYLNVEPRRYRFLFLNGSNARTYELFLTNPITKVNGPSLWVIGNDGGALDFPAELDPNAAKPAPTRLVIMPGERYEVIVDFSALAPGTTLVMKNTAKAPYPGGDSPQGATTGRVMQFRVVACASGECGAADPTYKPSPTNPLRATGMVRLTNPATGAPAAGVAVAKVRQLTLNEVMGMPMPPDDIDPITGLEYEGGPLEILVNNTKWSGESSSRTYGDFMAYTVNGVTTAFSEIPNEGDVEQWEIINLTADAHPIHLHLVQFQLLQRRSFDVKKYAAAYGAAFPATCAPKDPLTGYCPGFGPPLNYDSPVANKPNLVGGNPDVTRYLANAVQLPSPQEVGWKDTILAPPGTVTKLLVRWAPTDLPASTPKGSAYYPFDPAGGWRYGYVWHCHIIDHEDNEMMRPDLVNANTSATRSLVLGRDY